MSDWRDWIIFGSLGLAALAVLGWLGWQVHDIGDFILLPWRERAQILLTFCGALVVLWAIAEFRCDTIEARRPIRRR